MTARLAVVMSGFPRTSETFALGELVALNRAGMLARVYATKPGDGAAPQPGVSEILPLLRMLPDGDAAEQAAAIVDDLGDERVDGLHGYFAHRPAEVAASAARMLGVGSSFSVHALDARKVPAIELADRSRGAIGVIACNTDVAQHVDVPGARVRLLPHGVDLDRFRPGPRRDADGPLRVLAVGRLVEKKGFPTLLAAMARLSVPCVLRIVGTGAQHGRLTADIERLGLAGTVELAGRRSHEQLPADYAWADVVAVPSVVDSSGDRDGLPNVALEAMACGRPLAVSDVAALGSAVRDAGSGVVVPPGDPGALADALTTLADQRVRESFGAAGRRHVEEHFDLAACTRRLVEHLNQMHTRTPEVVDA
ncbi:MAG: glycosyltransferase family 4 protein [Nocardioidaceae bacterium]